jgi:hypothetical protein
MTRIGSAGQQARWGIARQCRRARAQLFGRDVTISFSGAGVLLIDLAKQTGQFRCSAGHRRASSKRTASSIASVALRDRIEYCFPTLFASRI